MHGRIVGLRKAPPGTTTGTTGISFLHQDHLGSTAMVTPYSGGWGGARTYQPYGLMLTSLGDPPTDLRFTGQREEAGDVSGLGLYNYKARFYSTVLGRFVSADPVVGSQDSQGWNSYTYARNNPLFFIDEDGELPSEPATAAYRCDRCDALHAMAALGIFSEEAWGLTLISVANMFLPWYAQTADFWGDLAGATDPATYLQDVLAGNVRATYSVDDLVADVSGVSDLATLFSPDASLKGRALAVVMLASPIPGDRLALSGFKAGRWLEHFVRHRDEFQGALQYDNAVEYLLGANRLIQSEGTSGVLSAVRKRDGATVFYRSQTNEFAVRHADGTLGTYMKPADGYAYFIRDLGR